ncbi:MAG: MFS transporter, partial [Streptosporangiaceae bacterium]
RLVFAAGPFGTMTGAIAYSPMEPARRRTAWLGPLAIAACGALLLLAFRLDLMASLVVLAVSGAGASYQLAANAAFVAAVPPERRGQAFGLANGGMQVFQGLWIVLAGAIAEHVLPPGTVIAISGGTGAALAVVLAVIRRRDAARSNL